MNSSNQTVLAKRSSSARMKNWKHHDTRWATPAEAARHWIDTAADGELEVVGIDRLAETAAEAGGATDAYPFAKAAAITRLRRLLEAAVRVGAAQAENKQ